MDKHCALQQLVDKELNEIQLFNLALDMIGLGDELTADELDFWSEIRNSTRHAACLGVSTGFDIDYAAADADKLISNGGFYNAKD